MNTVGPDPVPSRRWSARSRLRRTNLRNLPIVAVTVVAAASLAYSAAVPPHWLRGVMGLAGGMLLAGSLRLVLPARQAGLLAVRNRLVDTVFYIGIGAAIIFLGVTLAAAGSA
ncbi:MAG TPA: DUF3017 domain-containing protein [Mycobacteriales bacterium]|nr:DUF3017 domain-containing protein [Mycobacteriales bacterium]